VGHSFSAEVVATRFMGFVMRGLACWQAGNGRTARVEPPSKPDGYPLSRSEGRATEALVGAEAPLAGGPVP
jgi:hypothetical protein